MGPKCRPRSRLAQNQGALRHQAVQDLVLHGVLEDAVGVLHDDDLVIDGVQDQYHEVAVKRLDRHDSHIGSYPWA